MVVLSGILVWFFFIMDRENYENYGLIEHFENRDESSRLSYAGKKEEEFSLPRITEEENRDVEKIFSGAKSLQRKDLRFNGYIAKGRDVCFRAIIGKPDSRERRIVFYPDYRDENNHSRVTIILSGKVQIVLANIINGVTNEIKGGIAESGKDKYDIKILRNGKRILALSDSEVILNGTIPQINGKTEHRVTVNFLIRDSYFYIKTPDKEEVSKMFQIEKRLEKLSKFLHKPVDIAAAADTPQLARLVYHNVSKRVLIMKAGDRYSHTVKVPEDSYLEFSYFGTSNNTKTKKNFSLSIERIKSDKREVIKLPVSGDEVWERRVINLSQFSETNVRILFTFDPDPREQDSEAILYLANPVIRKKREETKNVLLISLDTLRADHLGCYGYKRNTSPRIDKFAASYARFDNAFAHSSWTLPSHLSLFTSRYPLETGHILGKKWHVIKNSRMAEGIVTIAGELKRNRYKTLAVAGGGYMQNVYGFDRGFEEYHSLKANEPDSLQKKVDICSRWIEQNKDLNWFIFFHTFEIHYPYNHEIFKPDSADGTQAEMIARYDSGILYTDKMIGIIFDKLTELNLLENTLVIILSDHGESFYDQFTGKAENTQMGLHGHNLYDKLIRVPLIIGGPRITGHGKNIKTLTGLVDIMPTILDYADVDTEAFMRGKSIIPLFNNDSGQHRVHYAEALLDKKPSQESKSLRTINYKYILNGPESKRGESEEFYDIQTNKNETENIISLKYDIVSKFRNILRDIALSINENRKKLIIHKQPQNKSDGSLEEELKNLGYIGN